MTFAICLFIVLMQFLWKYVEDFVGKGLSPIVLGEMFLYAALSLVPMALPLAILLASLMTFGNLGERLELLAIKAAGISLFKAMRPLIIFITLVCVGAFFFQNEAMPRINVKFKSLLISIKQKSLEIDIPEGAFYSEITNYNLYVKEKDKETGLLKDVKIYDLSKGFEQMAVIVCDSGRMRMSSNKKYVLLNLYHGQQFSNFQTPGNTRSTRNNKFVPYSRENFREKEIMIPFNADFNRMDESSLQSTQIAKNIAELQASIDSIRYEVDSMNTIDRKVIRGHYRRITEVIDIKNNEPDKTIARQGEDSVKVELPVSVARIDMDSMINKLSLQDKVSMYSAAMANSEANKNDLLFRSMPKIDAAKKIRYHEVELHRKFVLSFACLIFFFIGAPLGAIIRKGGMGMPVVISVILFIVYYIIDNVGFKMARDGVLEIWQGVWLSSFVLFPLGVFLTYKAMNDSELFKPEAYGRFIRKILFIKSPQKMDLEERKEIVKKIPPLSQIRIEQSMLDGLIAMDNLKLMDVVLNYKKYEYSEDVQMAALAILKERDADIQTIIDKQDYKFADSSFAHFESSGKLTIVGYLLFVFFVLVSWTGFFNIVEISYLALWFRSMNYYFLFYKNAEKKSKIYHIVITLLLLVAFPIVYFYVKRQMEKDLKNIKVTKLI
ncbi:LptF/LptG family permease [Dysgonomonas sp. 216]|uniref:LptF/LptG family permease n=1 Tax=Dysgonomonas sp. 216 TaxID=2302934 RepID=UPI00351A5339